MEMKSPHPCPNTVTVRRNPPRRARPTPYSAAPLLQPSSSSKTTSAIRSFPIHDILSIEVPDKPVVPDSSSDSEKLKVFLRIRPIVTQQKVAGSVKNGGQKNVWPQNPNRKNEASKHLANKKNKKSEICLKVNDSHSVTLCPPQTVADVRRTKSEVYQGFSHVFSAETSQSEVYEKMVNPLVDDFLKGKSGMLAAMGPSGSGKTHTVFGSTRDPGMVSRALQRIFLEKERNICKSSRTFYLSMFEIYSERGKGEKIMDLSREGGDLYMQQSYIKGLEEVIIHDVQQAESLIASGMLKRSTAMTNSNIQSSRSQCIINIRCDFDEDAVAASGAAQSCTAILTIVDLAGAEREKRTGNQGARLLESNFINNTSMVFGLCLRSLLEHQKNPKKPFQKHFQYSLLTKYLRDFLEGKKRMALILTAKAGEEDYQDTSYLLRQASPFMNIKFENVDEQPPGNKRRIQTLSKTEQAKRMKPNKNEVCMGDELKGAIIQQPQKEEKDTEVQTDALSVEIPFIIDLDVNENNPYKEKLIPEKDTEVETVASSVEIPFIIDVDANENKPYKENITDSAKLARENQIMSNFSRALWTVLKEYKNNLEASVNKVDSLRLSLTAEKERCFALETELKLMKTSCTCGKEAVKEAKLTNCSLDSVELKAQVSSSFTVNLDKQQITSDIVTTSVTCFPDCFDTASIENKFDVQMSCSNLCEKENVDTREVSSIKKNNVTCEYVVFDKEDLKELEDTVPINEFSACDTFESAVSNPELLLHEDEVSSLVNGDQRKHKEEVSNAQVSCTDLSESESFQKRDILDDIVTFNQKTSYDEVMSISTDRENFEEQSNERVDVSKSNDVFDKEFKEVEERDTIGEITACYTFESAVSNPELLLHEDEVSSLVNRDQRKQKEEVSNAQVSCSDLSESESFQKHDILDDIVTFDQKTSYDEVISISTDSENFEEQSNEKVDVSKPNDVIDKEFKEVEERETNGELTGCDNLKSDVNDSELLVLREKSPSFLKGDQCQHDEEDSNEQDSSSNPSELECFEKQERSSVEVISISSDFENFEVNTNEKVFVSSPNVMCDKEKIKEVEEREANKEITDAGQDSELPSVVVCEVLSSLDKDQLEQEEKEVNVPISSSDLEGSKCVGNMQFTDATDAPGQQSVPPKDVIISQKCNTLKLSEVPSVQTCQSNPVKPKRRLRPASSVMLKNINILEFDDATEMPKHGKRREKEDDGRKLTQGSSSLLRILKQNIHH